MAFWGIEVKPGKPYTYKHSNEQGRLHLSQATLGTGKSTKKSIVQCNIGDKKPIYLCSLVPERIENCLLNLEFEEDDEVTFSIVGPQSVHLSGFFFGVSQEDTVRDDYESDSYGEDIAETESEESTDYDTEDEYEDDFIDDDFGGFPPSPVPKSGVIIEEILDDEKPTNENGMSKRPKKKNHSKVSDGNDDSQRQIVVKNRSGVAVLESEDEDGFPIPSTRKSKTDVLKDNGNTEETKDDREYEKVKKKKAKDDHSRLKCLKRKADAVVPDDEQARETGQVTAEVLTENDLKKKKRKNKKKATLKGEATKDIDQALPVGEEHDQKRTTDKSLEVDADSTGDAKHTKENKKKKKKTKKQKSEANTNTAETVTKNESTMEIEEKSEAKAFQMRSFPNGLAIEELVMGKPDGKKASPGRQVSVHYIGKLKNNGKIFDSNVGRAPFKFRLGVGQVIKGWDVGVNGMRVGDKRRLTIPPAMGYGARGAGPAIPSNSWLVFDVELVDVR